MKLVEQRGAVCSAAVDLDTDRFQGIRAYLAALGSHIVRGRREDLDCMLIVAQSVSSLAPALGLYETGKRAQALQIFLRGIVARDGVATSEERSVLSRAYDRLTAAMREEGGR